MKRQETLYKEKNSRENQQGAKNSQHFQHLERKYLNAWLNKARKLERNPNLSELSQYTHRHFKETILMIPARSGNH